MAHCARLRGGRRKRLRSVAQAFNFMREKTRMHYLVKTGVRAVKILTTAVALGVTASAAAVPRTPADGASIKLATDIFKQLVEINTTDSVGNTTIAAEAMAKRLRDAGIPAADIFVGGPNPRKGNMVARLRGKPGSTLKPILLLAHIDVVEAKKEDWSPD